MPISKPYHTTETAVRVPTVEKLKADELERKALAFQTESNEQRENLNQLYNRGISMITLEEARNIVQRDHEHREKLRTEAKADSERQRAYFKKHGRWPRRSGGHGGRNLPGIGR